MTDDYDSNEGFNLDSVQPATPGAAKRRGAGELRNFINDALIPWYREEYPDGWNPNEDLWHLLVDVREAAEKEASEIGDSVDEVQATMVGRVSSRLVHVKRSIPGLQSRIRGSKVFIGWADPLLDDGGRNSEEAPTEKDPEEPGPDEVEERPIRHRIGAPRR